jgi:hypothetical protein
MGRPQVEIAEALRLSPSAVTKLVARARREGRSLDDESVLTEVLAMLTREDSATLPQSATDTPQIVVLKRNRG